MSDHFDTDEPRTDLTDLYVFPSTTAGRTVLVVDFNPEPAGQDVPFDPGASYEVKIDTDGDAEADLAFHVIFSSSSDPATATLYRARELPRANGHFSRPIDNAINADAVNKRGDVGQQHHADSEAIDQAINSALISTV